MESNEILVIHGDEKGVMTYEKGLSVAEMNNLDLVEVSSKSNPPVFKIMDLGKHLFEKKEKRIRKPKKS